MINKKVEYFLNKFIKEAQVESQKKEISTNSNYGHQVFMELLEDLKLEGFEDLS